MGMALQRLAKKTLHSASPPTRSRTDADRRYGRAAPRDHRRSHEARVQSRGECRQAAGRLSRDHSRHGRVRRQARQSSPAGAASTDTCGSRSSPNETGKGVAVKNGIIGGTVPREFIPAVEKGVKGGLRHRRHGGLSGRGRQGDADRRVVPRRRLGRNLIPHGGDLRGFKDGFRRAKP